MKTHWAAFLISTFVALLSGCKTVPTSEEHSEPLVFKRGIVKLVEGQLEFTPCYEQQIILLDDHTGRLYKRLSTGNEPLIYTEVDISEFADNEKANVKQVHMMGGGLATCRYELEEIEYRAAGDNPVWIADVSDTLITVQNYETMTRLKFKKNDVIQTTEGLEWLSEISGDVDASLSLNLEQTPCKDRYGTEYEFRAVMRLSGKTYLGCARKGNLDLQSLPGKYQAVLPVMEGVQRTISMSLGREGGVTIEQDYHNDQPLVIHQGSWQRLPKKRLVIYLTGTTGDGNQVLLLQRNNHGALELKAYSPIYGDSGLLFQRTADNL